MERASLKHVVETLYGLSLWGGSFVEEWIAQGNISRMRQEPG